jgi:hypothetical protein
MTTTSVKAITTRFEGGLVPVPVTAILDDESGDYRCTLKEKYRPAGP